MWSLRYSRTVYNYMLDNAGYVNGVRDALRLLATNDQGVPPWGTHHSGDSFYITDMADHHVEYELRKEGRLLIVWSIQPIE
jgi:hypothetical protein